MLLGYVLLQVMYVALYVGSSVSDSEDSREVQFPFPKNVLNSVLERLERSRQERLETDPLVGPLNCNDPEGRQRHQFTDWAHERHQCIELNHRLEITGILPEYTEMIQDVNVRERNLRHLTSQKHLPICLLERKIRKLNTDEYEYRPAYYEEVNCVPGFSNTNEICTSLGFSCVQWNKTIHLTRRRYTSDCWETKTMVIPAGCECMWPAHNLGDMKLHI